jgi:hypothetical protein
MSLTEHGMLRWYTNCCQTPIGNTPRDFKMSHLGLIHTCLERSGIGLDPSFGSVKMYVSRENAKGQPASTPITTFIAAVIRYLSSLTWSRISGKYKQNPFFDRNTGRPIKEPNVLTTDEHKQLIHTVLHR